MVFQPVSVMHTDLHLIITTAYNLLAGTCTSSLVSSPVLRALRM